MPGPDDEGRPQPTAAGDAQEGDTDEGPLEATYDRLKSWFIRIETWSVVLIAVATVATAWSAYQAHRWGGVQSVDFVLANTNRSESVRASNLAAQQVAIDVNLFTDWAAATAADDRVLADFLSDRFREEFKPAFDAWLKLPGTDDIPEGTPFELPEYQLAQRQRSDQLLKDAGGSFESGKTANQNGDNFILLGVLFAAVLFFGGISTRFDRFGPKVALLSIGSVIFVGAAIVVIILPGNVGF